MRSVALTELAWRLQRSDMIQVMTVVWAALVFVLMTQWPSTDAAANESWFGVAQARLVAFSLVALAYGSVTSIRPLGEQRATVMALVILLLLTAPLDVAAYAATFPATPLWWATALPVVDTVAFFGIGLALGWLLGRLRLRALLPLAVPGLLVGGVALDVYLGVNLLNPLTAILNVAAIHLVIMSAVALLSFLLLFRRQPAPEAVASEEVIDR